MKKRKTSKKKTLVREREQTAEKGFDFGEPKGVMAVSNVEFVNALTKAEIVACGYGELQVDGFTFSIPCLTLIGTDESALKAAFEHFKEWGCESDGDVVDLNIILRTDGSYELRIGPEPDRTMFRLIRQAELYRPFISTVFYVKRLDTTHPILRRLQQYRESPFSPVAVTAATAKKTGQKDFSTIKPLEGLPRLVKLELQVVDESIISGDARLYLRNKGGKVSPGPSPRPNRPNDLCVARKRIFDVAFPVSRERILRSGLIDVVRSLNSFEKVSTAQVVQSAINLMLSDELIAGDRHYSKIGEELSEKIWQHVAKRFEIADGTLKPANQNPSIVAHQIELDVWHSLRRHGIPTTGKKFVTLQALFRRKGYIDD